MEDKEKKLGKELEEDYPSRVIIENQDGTVNYLEGEDAKKWNKVVNNLVTLDYLHGEASQEELGSLNWKSAASLQDIPTTEVE